MSAHISLQQRIDEYLAERRRLGFELRSWDTFLTGFACYVADRKHREPLTADLMIDWAKQDKDVYKRQPLGRNRPVAAEAPNTR